MGERYGMHDILYRVWDSYFRKKRKQGKVCCYLVDLVGYDVFGRDRQAIRLKRGEFTKYRKQGIGVCDSYLEDWEWDPEEDGDMVAILKKVPAKDKVWRG